jgi:hypothetical protein
LQRRADWFKAVPHREQERVLGKHACPQQGELDGVGDRVAAIQRLRDLAELVDRRM